MPGMRKPWLIAAPLALLALASGMWLAHSRYSPPSPAGALPPGFWQLAYPDAQGQPQTLAQWRGKTLVVNFWASWCAPCREEMPDFSALRRQYRGSAVEVIGIAVDTPQNVRSYLQQHPVDYPVLVGEGGAHALSRQLGNPDGALPFTIVLDRQGKVVLRHLGRLPRAVLDATLRKIDA